MQDVRGEGGNLGLPQALLPSLFPPFLCPLPPLSPPGKSQMLPLLHVVNSFGCFLKLMFQTPSSSNLASLVILPPQQPGLTAYFLLQGAGDEAYLVTCPEHSKIRNELDLVPQMPIMPDQRISPDVPLPRSHSGRAERNHSGGGSGGHSSKTCKPHSHTAFHLSDLLKVGRILKECTIHQACFPENLHWAERHVFA